MTSLAVVEDNQDNRLLLAAILEDEYEIHEYECGVDALAGMLAAPPDVVLMDISLPGMDGEQILEEMRRTPELASIPVIALTAHAMSGDRERFLCAGFDGYVSKPILDEELLLSAILDQTAGRLRRSA